MEVRDHDHVNVLGVEPGGRQIAGKLPDTSFARCKGARTVTGVDDDKLAPGVDNQRREVHGDFVFWQKRLFKRGADFVLLGIEHEGVTEREGVHAIRNDIHLHFADLIAVEARRLLVGERCRGLRSRSLQQRRGSGRCGSGECMTSCQFHGDSFQ